MIPVPIEGWLADALRAAGGCAPSCSILGVVQEQHILMSHNGREQTFRIVSHPDHRVWDWFLMAWRTYADDCHGRVVALAVAVSDSDWPVF